MKHITDQTGIILNQASIDALGIDPDRMFTFSRSNADVNDIGVYDQVLVCTVENWIGNSVVYTVKNGTFTIEPFFGTITVKSANAFKEYDGIPLTNNTVTVTCDDYPWITEEMMALLRSAFTFNVTGSQTLVGSSKNYFTYEIDESILKPTMYASIEKQEGTLTVSNR